MNASRRLEYLQAMGIEAWRLRRPAAAGQGAPMHDRASDQAPAPVAVPAPAPAAASAAVAAAVRPPAASGARDIQIASQVPADLAELDWSALRARVAACTACSLSTSRTQTVFGVGDTAARWLIIGEAPGAEEDRRGEPFVGRAGLLLNAMLRALGLAREQVFIANVLKCRPPGNRDPKPEEARACAGFLHRQIALIQPAVILAVGRIAAQNLLGVEDPLGKLRQTVYRFGPAQTPLVVTYHPAYLLRSPGEKRKAWEDLKLAKRVMESGSSAT